jgi:CRP/FNR family cyclic AMP-dependent transcriptional regulator
MDERDRRSDPGPTSSQRNSAAGDIAPSDRARLISRFGRAFTSGEALFREGEPAKEAFLLQEGRVRLLKRVRLIERSLIVLRPGDLFGESALLDASARNSTAVALTDGVALALDRDTFRSLLEHHPSVAGRVLDQLIRRVRDAEDQIEIMMLKDTQSKIVSALLKLTRTPGPGGGPAELNVTPVELSSRVGLDVDTVKRGVQRLREQQYVKIVGERVEIPDVEALRKLYVLLGTKEELRGDAPPPGR